MSSGQERISARIASRRRMISRSDACAVGHSGRERIPGGLEGILIRYCCFDRLIQKREQPLMAQAHIYGHNELKRGGP
jgi:hypothetical protein